MTDSPQVKHHGSDMFEGYPVDTADTAGDQAVTNYTINFGPQHPAAHGYAVLAHGKDMLDEILA